MRLRVVGTRYALAAAIVVGVVAVFAGAGQATGGKLYSASITPATVGPGASSTFSYTVKNLDATQPLGSFRVAIPSGGWTVTAVSVTSSPSGKLWAVTPGTLSLGYIEAKAKNNNARLANNQSVIVGITTIAPCSGGPFLFQSEAHQANQFQGPNNEFTQVNGDADRTVSLAVGGGAVASVSIDTVATPQEAGKPFDVTVRTFDSCGNATTGAAGATLAGLDPSPSGQAMTATLKANSGTSAVFSVTGFLDQTAPLTATVFSKSAQTPNQVTIVPGELGRLTIDEISSPQTAGARFLVTAHPFDRWGNAKWNYTGVPVLDGDLTAASKSPPLPSTTAPEYGTFDIGANGLRTAWVTAKKAEGNRHVTVTDSTSATAVVTATSSPGFAVVHGALALAFAKQPGAAELGQQIPSTAPPAPITVLAEDAYGNPGASETVRMTGPSVLAGTMDGTTSAAGEATYTNLSIATVGIYRLTAQLDSSPAAMATSDEFGIVNDLQRCDDVKLCLSTADNGKQTTASKITTSDLFQDIVFTTTFLPASASQCGAGFVLVPGTETSDVSIQSGNVDVAKPEFLITLIIRKQTLQAAGYTQRSAASFDACAGATWIDQSTMPVPWTTKSGEPATLAGDGFYWGIAADCSSLPTTTINPCVALKTKNASQLVALVGALPDGVSFKSGDLALVVRERFGWDGRISIGG